MAPHASKRKSAPVPMDVDVQSSHKKARTDKNEGAKDKGKGKSHDNASGEFRAVKASVVLAIPPAFASKPKDGAEEMLDSMVMRYMPALRGVVLAHSKLEFLTHAGRINGDSPYVICNVGFEAMIWSPEVGMKLSGKINLCSPDHISLLVHRTFNVSIPRHHIPTDEWEFEYGPAENDPEFSSEAAAAPDPDPENDVPDAKPEEGIEAAEKTEEKDEEVDRGGRWIHKVTGVRLGGEEGLLEFTVVGCVYIFASGRLTADLLEFDRLTIANQMLSLLGSIQVDPFSLAHASQSTQPQRISKLTPATHPALDVAESDEEDALEFSSDDEVVERQVREVRPAPAAKESKKKRKRKDKEGQVPDAGAGEVVPKKTKKKKT
ncbi:hypothetical protein EVG20_g873 [Dentipellis fragilis]|uniref:RPA43 OB domain-containing protein n=1 Tax=Dentipellis fragilis TaxID=205917 RepID=A0A4Y9ZDT9_9AGAM|nr:hypothetical protein EVG20_g873 [Dentipellis fragilis]